MTRKKIPQPRTGTPDPRLSEGEFRTRFLSQFSDPAFDALREELNRVAKVAWDAYSNGRKAPRTRTAGAGFADPTYDLGIDWLAARETIHKAQARHDDPAVPASILPICASARSEHTSTQGKDAKRAKQIELQGWDYPRHLAGRLFSVIVHGDVEGAENVRRSVSDWLRATGLVPAGPLAELDRYIGYWEPYATSHDALDADTAVQEEVRNAARTLLEAVQASRAGRQVSAGSGLKQPRQK